MQANAQREPASAALDATPQAEGPTAAAAAAAAVVSQTVSDEQPPASAVAEPLPASADAQGAELASAASTPVGAELQPDGTESGATDTSGEPAAAAASMPEANGTLQGVDEAVAVTTAQDQPSADGSSSACQPCGAAAAAEPCAAAPCEATPAALASPMPAEEPDQGGDACQRHAATQTEPPALPIWHQQRRAAAEEAERAAEQAGRTLKRMEELGDLAIAAAAALTIQRWARGWLARRTAAALREAAAAARQYEVLRRMQLRTPADFLLLFDELAQWWGQEQAKIAAAQGLTDAERQAARRALLAKETRLLQTIDRLRAAAAPLLRAERAARQLAAAAAPQRWRLADGRELEVATPATLQVGELAAAHAALVAADGRNLDARLAALLAAKFHAKALDCRLTREIVALVDREAELLNRGRDPDSLAGLRQRLANLFLDYALGGGESACLTLIKSAASPAGGGRAASKAAAVQTA